MKPVWSHIFDSRKRHCWSMNNGTRRLDQSAPEYDTEYWFSETPETENICTTNHYADPRVVGKVEWLRFIHAFHSLGHIWGEVKIVPEGEVTASGTPAFCEVYKDFKVFLKHEEGWAIIECYNADYIVDCDTAYNRVIDEYNVEVPK